MFVLSCESTIDLPFDYVQKRNIPVLLYSYTVDGEEIFDDMQKSPDSLDKFYQLLKDNKRPMTSQICQERYLEFFREQLKKGDLLHVAFGSGMSQSVSNAFKAVEVLQKEFPSRKIYVVDSLCSCVGYGLLVDTLADMRDRGKDIDCLYSWAEQNKNKVHHQFFSTTLTYFRKSGRVSGPAAFIGNMLKLCPIMHLNKEGKIIAYAKVMCSCKAIKKTLQEVDDLIEKGLEYNGKLWLAHSNCIELAHSVLEKLRESYKKADIRLYNIGPVIAAHSGPGTVAVFFMGDERQ